MKLKFWIVVVGLFMTTFTFAQGNEVSLLQAELHQTCSSAAHVTGALLVKNIAYQKRVFVTVQIGNEAPFAIEAAYDHDLGGGYEAWSFQTMPTTSQLLKPVRLDVRYEVAGQAFFDQHCDNGYLLDMQASRIVAGQCRE